MGRLTMAGALMSVALGAALALPVAAQAAAAPAAGITRVAVPDIPPNGEWQFVASYPGTPAGLAACQAEGVYLNRTYPHTDPIWECRQAGDYQLWVYFEPGGVG